MSTSTSYSIHFNHHTRNKYLNKTIPKKRGHSGVIVFAETLEKLKQKS